MKITEVYTDGGLIKSNPSKIAGTWAFIYIYKDGSTKIMSGVVTPQKISFGSRLDPVVTNNQTEMLALLLALAGLPDNWQGHLYSDSMVSLGRLFDGWKWKNIPLWMYQGFMRHRDRINNFDKIPHTLVAGHPTKKQLAEGIGKRGLPVSVHNVSCDLACREAGEKFLDGDRNFTDIFDRLFA